MLSNYVCAFFDEIRSMRKQTELVSYTYVKDVKVVKYKYSNLYIWHYPINESK